MAAETNLLRDNRRASRMDELGDRVAQVVQESGYTLDDLLLSLDEEREVYYAKHCLSKSEETG